MIKYKRIYPLKQNGRLGAVLTVLGREDSAQLSVKLKVKPDCDSMVLILFCPKTYDYIMEPFAEQMYIGTDTARFTAAVLACKNGRFIEFLMEGSANRTPFNSSRLKSRITMDLYSSGEYVNPPLTKAKEEEEEEGPPDELLEYIRQMEEGDMYSNVWDKEQDTPPYATREEAAPLETEPSPDSEVRQAEEAEGKYCRFVNPFKDRWEGVWWQVQYPDRDWHYIVGRVVVDGSNVSVIGVPGDRYRRPATLNNCDMYAVADNGTGYWLVFQK